MSKGKGTGNAEAREGLSEIGALLARRKVYQAFEAMERHGLSLSDIEQFRPLLHEHVGDLVGRGLMSEARRVTEVFELEPHPAIADA